MSKEVPTQDDESDQFSVTEEEPLKDLLDKLPERDFGDERYNLLIAQYQALVFDAPKLDPKKAHRLDDALIGNGKPKWELNGKRLEWISGLAAFCGHSGSNVIAEMINAHSDLKSDLYEVVTDKIDEFDQNLMYDEDQDPYAAPSRGAYLAPNLDISERQYLTPAFIGEVLRPYLSVSRIWLSMFWRQIGDSHMSGQFLMFAQDSEGDYGKRFAGEGLVRVGDYEIPREAYLAGLEENASDIAYGLMKPAPAGFNPSKLLFLGSDQVPDYCLDGKSKKATRPKGINFYDADAPIVDEMRELIVSGIARSVSDAARRAYDANEDKVVGGGSEESKLKRLVRSYKRTQPSGG